MMGYAKNFTQNLVILFVCLTGLGLVFCFSRTPLTGRYSSSCQVPQTTNFSKTNLNYNLPKDELEQCLSKASMEDKTVILTIVNKAYVEPQEGSPAMFDIFLEGFWVGEETQRLLDNLMVVAMDETAYRRCLFRRLNCYRLVTEDVDFASEKLYMSEEFIKMMWARTEFLLQVLKRGYHFIFTDTDVVWLRNPFLRLNENRTEDLQISTDVYLGNPWNESNPINTGFYLVRANNKTIRLFETWYDSRVNATGLKEQDVLSNLIHGGVIEKLGLKIRFLDTLYFSGFCRDSKDIRLVGTVHANCCRSISAKIADLNAILRDWKRYRQSAVGIRLNDSSLAKSFKWSKHRACWKSWRESRTIT